MTIKITPLHGIMLLLGVVAVLLGLNLAQNMNRPPAASTPGTLPAAVPTTAASGGADSVDRKLLFEYKGTEIGKGSNSKPVGNNGPQSYRVEEVTLPQPHTFDLVVPDASQVKLEQKKIEVTKFWRLILTGGPFDEGDSYWSVWVDNTLIGIGVTDLPATEMTVIVVNRTYLREGATITLALGKDRTKGVALPEPLHIEPGH